MIKEWLCLAPIHYDGENGGMGLAEQQIPEEADLRPRPGQRVRLWPAEQDELVWTRLHLEDYLIDFDQVVRARAEWCAAYAVC
jgi:hypothetical protein